MALDGFKQRWEEMEPAHKQKVMWGVSGIGVLLLGMVILAASDDSGGNVVAERIESSLLPEGSARDLGVTGIGREVDKMIVQMRAQEERIAELKRQLELNAKSPAAASTDARLHSEIVELKKQIAEIGTRQPAQVGGQTVAPESPPAGPVQGPGSSTGNVTTSRPMPGQGMPLPQAASDPAYGQIRTIEPVQVAQTQRNPARDERNKDSDTAYIPAGAMLQAVLLSGADAPSGRGATSDPVPLLARVKFDLILPNRFRSSLRECFLLLEGFGELSSERVQARTNVMSCISKDKNVIEVPLQGYAVGDDGKAGIRGVVMSKQGRALGMAFLAGIADGAAQAMGGNQGVGLGAIGTGNVDLSNVGNSAATRGASGALDRIAAFYLERADELFPVVSIEATRTIGVVLLKGAEIRPID